MSHRPNRRLVPPLLVVAALLSLGCGSSDSGAGGGTPPEFVDGSGSGGSAGSGGAGGGVTDGGREGAGAGGAAGTSLPPTLGADGLFNNPAEELVANPDRSPFDLLDSAAGSPDAYGETVAFCFDGPDACESSSCTPLASCCVATGGCCLPLEEAPLPEALDFTDCGASVENCGDSVGFDVDTFGDPLITARGLVPNGSPTSEGGALLGSTIRPTNERIVAAAQFAPPLGCNGSCLESAGFGFAADTESSSFRGAEVGLLFSGSRAQVSVLIGDQVVDAFDAGSATTVWGLVLSPAGTVEVRRDGTPLEAYPFDVNALSRARLAFFGRSLFSNTNSAAISRLTTSVELCDSPRGWNEGNLIDVTLDDSATSDFDRATAPSIIDDPAATLVAFELADEIYLGDLSGDSIDVSSLSVPLVPSEPFELGGISDPELFTFADALYLYYTAFDGDGNGSIASAPVVDGQFAASSPVLTPDADVVSFEAPTVHSRDGLTVMVVRATLETGATELRIFYTSDPETGWQPVVDGTIEALTRVDSATEEITSPSIIVHNSAYQLYYARRVGTRWTIEVAASDELVFWRPLGDALGGSGVGFDSLGARGLDARSGIDEVDALYMGQDGVAFRLGRALRPAPSDTAPTAF